MTGIKYDKCILGGSFNPITSAHLMVLELCCAVQIAEEYLIMPCDVNSEKPDLIESSHRLNMCNIAINEYFTTPNNIRVTDFDIIHKTNGESFNTIQKLQEVYEGQTIVFVIGSDVLPNIKKWPTGKEFAAITDFLIAYRPGYPIDQEELKILKKYYLLDELLAQAMQKKQTSTVSSTKARELILYKNKTELKEYLTEGVIQYINEHKLYSKKL